MTFADVAVQIEALLTQPAWPMLEYDLAAAMYSGLKSYWQNTRKKADAGMDFIAPPLEVNTSAHKLVILARLLPQS